MDQVTVGAEKVRHGDLRWEMLGISGMRGAVAGVVVAG